MNIAAILAGGVGKRMGGGKPKQFLPVNGRMVIEHSVDAFEKNSLIDRIVIVMHPDWAEEMQAIVRRNGWKKVTDIVPGGKERYHSSMAAIECCRSCGDDDRLIIHDAARPWVSQRIITEVCEALNTNKAIGVGIPVTDTIWMISDEEGRSIQSIPDRALMYNAQTPQAFHLSTIREAYSLALQDPGLKATDDCGIIVRYLPGTPIHIVPGENTNIKITFPEDIR